MRERDDRRVRASPSEKDQAGWQRCEGGGKRRTANSWPVTTSSQRSSSLNTPANANHTATNQGSVQSEASRSSKEATGQQRHTTNSPAGSVSTLSNHHRREAQHPTKNANAALLQIARTQAMQQRTHPESRPACAVSGPRSTLSARSGSRRRESARGPAQRMTSESQKVNG